VNFDFRRIRLRTTGFKDPRQENLSAALINLKTAKRFDFMTPLNADQLHKL
jgi:hypothetical protein